MATITPMIADGRPEKPCIGRFAPSPTGPLHAGSLVAALASWLDVRARGGRWLVRIEDIDTPRCVPGADQEILRQLAALGLRPDEPPWWQSQRGAAYAAALASLQARGLAYACRCSRAQIAAMLAARGRVAARHGELVYPGTCRPGPPGGAGKTSTEDALPKHAPRAHAAGAAPAAPATPSAPSASEARAASAALAAPAASAAPAALTEATGPTDAAALPHPPGAHRQAWRLRLPEGEGACIGWIDRRLGAQRQDVAQAVGDFVLRRADGLWAYQLAVVVDDAAQGVSDVVRGEDLADNTPRQILLQRALGLPSPRTLHAPLLLSADGEKLSKQQGAAPLAVDDPLAALQAAGAVLGLRVEAAGSASDWLAAAVKAWRRVWIDGQTF